MSVATRPLWRNISFTLMWTSTAASGFGDRMIMLAGLALLGGMIAGADSTSTQASTQFWFFAPYIVFSMVGGWLADHVPRKWLLLACDEARGLILLLSCLLVTRMTGSAAIARDAVWFTVPGFEIECYQHWKVYASLFAIGTFASIFNPTRNAIIPQIIPASQLTAGNAVVLVINVIASQIGLLLGKQIISQEHAGSVQTGLLIGATFYLASGTFFAFLQPTSTHPVPRSPDRSWGEALAYVIRHRCVVILIFLNILVWPSAAVVTSALFGLGKMHYRLAGDELLGHFANLSVTLGVGMLIGAVVVCVVRTRQESPLVYLSALIVAGMGVLILATVPVLIVAYGACLLIGISGNVAIVCILSLLQSITPNYVRGRIMGLNTLLNTFFSVATYFAIWQLPDADHNIVQVMLVLGPTLMAVGIIGLGRHLISGIMPNRTANAIWRVNRLLFIVWHRLLWIGRDRIPRTGPVILVSNHTTGIDPMLIQAASPRIIRWLMLTRYRFKVAEPLWSVIKPITLDLDGNDLAKIRAIVKVLRSGEVVGIFPEGGLQRTHRGLQPFQPGVAMVAKRSEAAIVPIWISGTPQRRHMLWHFLQPSRSVIRFGKPYHVDKSRDSRWIMEDLRQRMQQLGQEAIDHRE